MDVHYRRELDALVASKAAVEAELRELREGAAVTGPALRLPQPAAVPLPFIPQPAALPGVRSCCFAILPIPDYSDDGSLCCYGNMNCNFCGLRRDYQ